MAIRILAPHEAAKIAAGEVIERPASVVKELVENSLDAGSTQIVVEIREGGLTLIRVADNGCGIEPGELRLAFERHATSKVAAEEDLWRVTTLGFRGEALPSIAAAADVELLTRVVGNDRGARLRVQGGGVREEGSGATAPGTAITVRGLFAAQPARLKFLRGSGAESAQVSTVVMHYAMAYPHVRFMLTVDGRTSLQTAGSGRLVDTVAAVYGAPVAAATIEIEVPPANEAEPGLRGLVAEPGMHRASRNYIGLYVNRRWVRNRTLTFAVEDAYQGMLPAGRHPIAVLDLQVPPEDVDVNVHPTKADVRLRRERELFGLLQRTVRRALSEHTPVPPASPALWTAAPPLGRPALILRPQPSQGALRVRHATSSVEAPGQHETAAAPARDRLPMLRPVGQVANLYVVAEGPDGMYLIDQHAAHERALYERFLAEARSGHPDAQGLLEPLTVELIAAHQALVLAHAEAFARMGFDIEPFGDAAFAVRAVPSSLAGEDVARRMVELLDRMQRADGPDESSHRVAASLACHAAVRAGMTMNDAEQQDLVRQLEESESPRTCPHGRPTMVHLTTDAIAREFGRR